VYDDDFKRRSLGELSDVINADAERPGGIDLAGDRKACRDAVVGQHHRAGHAVPRAEGQADLGRGDGAMLLSVAVTMPDTLVLKVNVAAPFW
jgi:hypothetical protein